MINCTKCGSGNELGRVFCLSCGAKLDLSNLGSEEIVEMDQLPWIKRHYPKIIIAVVVIIVVCSVSLSGLIHLVLVIRVQKLGQDVCRAL